MDEQNHPIFLMLNQSAAMGNTVMSVDLATAIKRKMGLSYTPQSLTPFLDKQVTVLLHPGLGRGLATWEAARRAAGLARWAEKWAAGRHAGAFSIGQAPHGSTPSQAAAWAILGAQGGGLLTGRPGTGKTWLAAQMIHRLLDSGKRVMVCAPTGKAASVLQLKLKGHQVKTIHRTIGLTPGSIPDNDKNNPLDTDVLVVDETSMVDEELMFYLLLAVDTKRTAVLLVGDPNQLPPVGPGAPFLSFIKHGITRGHLTDIMRQEEGNGIIALANGIQDGKFSLPTSNVSYVHCDEKQVEEKAIEVYMDRERYGAMALSQALILSATKQMKFDASTSRLNERISHMLHKDRTIPNCKFTSGDRVMFTVNDYQYGFVNGEMGTLLMYDRKDRKATIRNDIGKLYDLENWTITSSAEWAYALTVHKAQGSESDLVVLAVTHAVPSMYTRELIYTAVTRAKRQLVIVGDVSVLKAAINKRLRRASALDYLMGMGDELKKYERSEKSLKGVMNYD